MSMQVQSSRPPTSQATGVEGWRIFLYTFAITVLLAALLLSAGAALGQASALNSLGCWGQLTGGGDQRSTSLHRIRDEITWVGGGMGATANRMRINSYSILDAWRAITGAPQAPIQNVTTNYMPLAMNAWNFPLSRLCS